MVVPQLDTPAPRLDAPAPRLDTPAPRLDAPAPQLDAPAPRLMHHDAPPSRFESPAPRLMHHDAPPSRFESPAARCQGKMHARATFAAQLSASSARQLCVLHKASGRGLSSKFLISNLYLDSRLYIYISGMVFVQSTFLISYHGSQKNFAKDFTITLLATYSFECVVEISRRTNYESLAYCDEGRVFKL